MPSRANALPLQVSRFVGREAELERLGARLAEGRLVTIWGTAGIGKTRLALEYGARSLAEDKCAVFHCELADARGVIGLCTVVGRTLDLSLPAGGGGADLVTSIGEWLSRSGPTLLILDDFEHLATIAAETLVPWLQAAPAVSFLVTSRERLRVAAETVTELGPLRLDADPGAEPEAVALFVDRARALGCDVPPENEPLVVELVTALEGIPLAIELAAGRMDTLGIEGMLAPMRQSWGRSSGPASHPPLDVLAGGRRDGVKRQQTLRDAILWSWELLQPVEQRALAQCSVFSGGFTPAAASQVLELGEDANTLDVIRSLRDKSLLRSYQPSPGEVRLALFESVREFAADQLEAMEQRRATVARHEAFFLDTAERLASRNLDASQVLKHEVENLMSIVERTLDVMPAAVPELVAALRALAALAPVFHTRGPVGVYLDWLDRALGAAEACDEVPLPVLAKAYQARGKAQPQRGRALEGITDLTTALTMAKSAGDRSTKATILTDLGVLYHHAREMDRAREHYQRALALHRGLGDRRAIGRVLGNLGALHHDLRDVDEALNYYNQALVIFRELGDRRVEGLWLTNLGALQHERGSKADARQCLERALTLLEDVGDKRLAAIALGNLGALHHEERQLAHARKAHRRALRWIREVGDRRSEGLCLARLGAVSAEDGRLDDAVTRLTDAEAMLTTAADPIALEFVAVAWGFVDLERAVRARDAGDASAMGEHVAAARARVARARAGEADKPAPAEVNDDIRIAIRIMEPVLERLDVGAAEALAPRPEVMLVGPDCLWVRPPHCAWQDFRRRRPLRNIVTCLVGQHEEAGAPPLGVDDLRAAGWPGETISHDAGVNRVHVALAELRKRGLKGVLLKTDEGYLIDPTVELRRVPSALCPA